MWRAYSRHYGKDSDTLVVQAATRQLNPTVPKDVVARALEEDEPAASAEWLALWRRDIEGYVSPEALDAVTVPGRFELPPLSGTSYVGFVDPSGGARDSFTLAIAHREERGEQTVAVLDCVRETRAPLSPEACVAEFAEVLKSYRLAEVSGDKYAAGFCSGAFERHGITYRPSERSKSQVYTEALPLLASGRVELLDHKRLRSQLLGLERRTARGGRDSIDHAPNGADDLANAAAGALVAASTVSRFWGFAEAYPEMHVPETAAEREARWIEERLRASDRGLGLPKSTIYKGVLD